MQIDVISIFPEMFSALTQQGITARALAKKIYQLHLWQLRDFADNAYRTIDDRPYGGGPGMVMLPAPLDAAFTAAKQRQEALGVSPCVVYLSPQGQRLDHSLVMQLSQQPGLVLLAGRYEGVDERVLHKHVQLEVSLGDYVLTGGELPAMVLIDAIVRQLPGALGDSASAEQDSFVDGLLDCPHYTRPEVYEGMSVPDVLLSGHHDFIRKWRLQQSLGRTYVRRPDLLAKRLLTKEESRLLAQFQQEQDS